MKISEYIEETSELYQRFGVETDAGLLLRIWDAIEFREGDVYMWYLHGLTEEDDVPDAPTRVLFPNFNAV